jgi:type I restriction enzyme S subunit
MNEFMRIGDICDILNGYAFKSSKYVADGIRVIRITNVQKGFVEDTNPQYYPVSEQREIEKYMLCEGDLLMSLTGNVGRVGLLSAEMLPAALNQRVACIRIRNPAVIYKPFLFHLLNSDYFENKCILASQGVAQKNMSTEWLKEYPIPSFSMDKQMEIASIFDKIDDLIARRKEQVRNMDQAVKSRFIELFGNYDLTHPQESWAPIKEVGTVVGGATPKTDHDEYWGGSYRWITPAELDADSGYIYDSVRKLTKAGVESCSLQEMPVGTVILSSRAPIGKVAIAGNTFYCNQGFKNIICKEGITPRYLYTVLLLNVEYLNSLGRGATFKEISKGIVESIRIPVPSMELQEQFAAFVEQTDKSKLCGKMEVAA